MRSSTRRRHADRLVGGLLIALGLVATALPSGVRGSGGQGLTATLDDAPIPLAQVTQHACHDRDYPAIRCFRTAAALETDEEVTAKPSTATRQQLLSPFVRWYQYANHGSAFFDALNRTGFHVEWRDR